jgi:hypothetical protein
MIYLIYYFFYLYFYYLNLFVNEEVYVWFFFFFCKVFYLLFLLFTQYFYLINFLDLQYFYIIFYVIQKIIKYLFESNKINLLIDNSAFELSFVIVSLFFFSSSFIEFLFNFLIKNSKDNEFLITVDNSNVLVLDDFIKNLVINCDDIDVMINFILFISTNNYEFLIVGFL